MVQLPWDMQEERLRQQLKALPSRPGVYLLKDREDTVLYVGKASSLYHRVGSYFRSPHTLSPKLQKMVSQVADFDFMTTASDQEAILLECNLIKEYRPRYNVKLKDDKSYPYLKIGLGEDWPGVYITRRLEKDGARYFGPFANAGSVRRTLALLRKLFLFRSCRKPITGSESRPCLQYHIHRCLGPCVSAISREDYREAIERVTLFLEGKQEAVVRDLRCRMAAAAESLEFEKAAL
ncbi:MAG: GIY-YIG nuclease family protein, partial [Chloroflexi bacterium]|nr:GIY-YIG nuclease family protein [Chloroflexota bacterium]